MTWSAARMTATPWAPAPRDTSRPAIRESAMTGQSLSEPKGVMVPLSYPVAIRAVAASGIDSRLTASSARSFGQEMLRSPGTSTNRKSSSPRRTTIDLITSAGSTPRARAASARLVTGACSTRRKSMPSAVMAERARCSPEESVIP